MKSFEELSLPAPLQQAITKLNFKTPTPIQSAAIPPAMNGKDILGCAQTGTGKTLAFSLPLLSKILIDSTQQALILAPTRELAAQIEEQIFALTSFSKHIRTALLIGGEKMNPQLRSLSRDPSIVVATPGRLIDHLERGSIKLDHCNNVVLDEADRMLDMGFAKALETIFKHLPTQRQNMLFSATLPPNILKLSSRYLTNPEKISVGEVNNHAEKVKITHVKVSHGDKNVRVLQELQARSGTTLVFTRTKHRTDRLANYLSKNGVRVAAIHGGRTQSQRTNALNQFKSGHLPVLIATDVVSRGLDISHIELVINFDLPETREDYVHRVGRTARAGKSGEALSFVTPDEFSHWKRISKIERAA